MVKSEADCTTIDHETGERRLETLAVYAHECENATSFRRYFREQNPYFDREIETVLNLKITDRGEKI